MNIFREWIKNVGKNLGEYLILLVVLVLFLLIVLFSPIWVPIDVIAYHKTPYYKATKRKYQLFNKNDDVQKFYNYLAKTGSSFEYACEDTLEYFLVDGQVLIPGWTTDQIVCADGNWYLSEETERGTVLTPVELKIRENARTVRQVHRAYPVKLLLLDEEDYDDDDAPQYRQCPDVVWYAI